MVLTWIFLKTKYRFRKIVGIVVCIAGLIVVVFSDVHAGDRAGKQPLLYHLFDLSFGLYFFFSFFFFIWLCSSHNYTCRLPV
jgi:drug/metabolite transporter (DMT)-like permease